MAVTVFFLPGDKGPQVSMFAAAAATGSLLLLETGSPDNLLLEDAFNLLLEA